ncbi:MAG TPA: PilZ domain-containing protein [Solirubrobacteraceae bacterium]|nr:PilZ domain-containing protein [Solirubrobacteraceae bacterium]
MTDQPEPTGKVIRLNVGGKEGKLTTPVGSHIPVRVFERGGDFLMLVLMLDDGEELGQDALEPLVLEYVSARGVVRFEGQAVLQERDLVRFEVSTEPEVTQRREFVRVPSLQSVVLDDGLGSVRIDGKAIDLSGGGMLLSGADRLVLDSVIRFRIRLGAGPTEIEGHARVVRADDQGRRALVFEEISEDDRQRLIHFVFERQREALAKVGRVIRPGRAR